MKSEHAVRRRERFRASRSLQDAIEALSESRRLTRRGDFVPAVRAARLAEQHARIAERLTDLKAQLRRIAQARHDAEQRLEEAFAAREEAVKAREFKLQLDEISLRERRRASAPLHPMVDAWQDLFHQYFDERAAQIDRAARDCAVTTSSRT